MKASQSQPFLESSEELKVEASCKNRQGEGESRQGDRRAKKKMSHRNPKYQIKGKAKASAKGGKAKEGRGKAMASAAGDTKASAAGDTKASAAVDTQATAAGGTKASAAAERHDSNEQSTFSGSPQELDTEVKVMGTPLRALPPWGGPTPVKLQFSAVFHWSFLGLPLVFL